MEDNPYACAVCEESFPIAKSLVNHVNDCHVSVQSSVEPKKVVKSMQTLIEHQNENDFEKDDDERCETGDRIMKIMKK